MLQASLTEVRNQARHYFDAVESGNTVRVIRNGRPIADIVPVMQNMPRWRNNKVTPLALDGVSLSQMIIEDRSR